MRTETYDFKTIESKWQKIWEAQALNSSLLAHGSSLKKFYCLVMFPYPSGKIHMGHARNYCIGDAVARYKRMRGYSVLHPIGWDAFGLPAENAAIEHKIDPEKWTKQNIRDMRQDIKSLGISYDWDREFATCDPEYYHWNQWFFIQMFKKGLAYRKKSAVNWCPHCQTVLANEQVHEGNCWRCHTAVTQKDLDQWFFKISGYAERLLNDLELLKEKWPDEVILMQQNWIGKSVGAEVDFEIAQSLEHKGKSRGKISDSPLSALRSSLKVFTTRPDTLFGCTFVVISPEHPLVGQMQDARYKIQGQELKVKIKEYCEAAKKKSKIERTSLEREKTGIFSGLYAVNPATNQKVPIWIADYVLSDYGTGAVMAVPAHDQRDFDFAQKYKLPIVEVISREHRAESTEQRAQSRELIAKSKEEDQNRSLGSSLFPLRSSLKEAYEGEGNLIHSGRFTECHSTDAKKKITDWLEGQGKGRGYITYRIRDWLISRQRYWGTPIPIIHCPQCGTVAVEEESLPVELPKNVQFTGSGKSPLAQVKEFVQVQCPQCKGMAARETDTMDTFVDSSWYFLRYCDPRNRAKAFDSEQVNSWMPVGQYIGGIEHACMHLIYSRFFQKVLLDFGLVRDLEPFDKLLTQGMVTLGGSAMSKSKGNIVAVETMVKEYGADTARLFVLFASPPKNQLEWSEDGVQGVWRFLNRIWRMAQKIKDSEQPPKVSLASGGLAVSSNQEDISESKNLNSSLFALRSSLQRKTHQTIRKVGEDIERDFQFNTAIAALMELLNQLSDYPALGDPTSKESFKTLLILLFPFAPHLSSEIWQDLGCEPALDTVPFPSYDPELLRDSVLDIVVQVNGKLRAKVSVSAEDSKNEGKVIPLAHEALKLKGLEDTGMKYKFVPGRLINFISPQKIEVSK